MKETSRKLGVAAAILGAITILIGAYGAHGLKNIVSTEAVTSFETGVRYQMYHVFALLILAFCIPLQAKQIKRIALFFWIGILFFSGSIYLLVLKEYLPFDITKFAFITPIGGLFFVIGWFYLAFHLIKVKKDNSAL